MELTDAGVGSSGGLIARYASRLVLEAVTDTRIVLVLGARQSGKSTLTKHFARHDYPAEVFNLDNPITRGTAADDPLGFVAGISGPAVIDEVQRVPELLLVIKERVDDAPRPG